jgi:hypothetical protein
MQDIVVFFWLEWNSRGSDIFGGRVGQFQCSK